MRTVLSPCRPRLGTATRTIYVLIHHIIFWLYLYFLNILNLSKYSCTNIPHRRSPCTFYGGWIQAARGLALQPLGWVPYGFKPPEAWYCSHWDGGWIQAVRGLELQPLGWRVDSGRPGLGTAATRMEGGFKPSGTRHCSHSDGGWIQAVRGSALQPLGWRMDPSRPGLGTAATRMEDGFRPSKARHSSHSDGGWIQAVWGSALQPLGWRVDSSPPGLGTAANRMEVGFRPSGARHCSHSDGGWIQAVRGSALQPLGWRMNSGRSRFGGTAATRMEDGFRPSEVRRHCSNSDGGWIQAVRGSVALQQLGWRMDSGRPRFGGTAATRMEDGFGPSEVRWHCSHSGGRWIQAIRASALKPLGWRMDSCREQDCTWLRWPRTGIPNSI